MNTKDECVCGHTKTSHFKNTGKCAVIVCHCTGYEAKPPFFLPHFEVDENTTWKRLLGELTFEVASVSDQITEVRTRAVTYEDLTALKAVVEQNEVDADTTWRQAEQDHDRVTDRLIAIEEQLPTFKKTRKGKKAKK